MSGTAGPSGPARSGGWRFGGGLPMERMETTPWDRITELEHELRVARFNEDGQRRRADEAMERLKRWHREDRAALERVVALVNVQRKTLRMEELLRALGLLDSR